MSGIKTCPEWVTKIKQELQTELKLDNEHIEITLFLPKTKRNRECTMAHYHYLRGVEMMVDNENKTDIKLWVLLHELGHALHHIQYGRIMREKGKKRRSVHPETFWKIVIPLYARYGVLQIALENEYIKGRKLIQEYINKTAPL